MPVERPAHRCTPAVAGPFIRLHGYPPRVEESRSRPAGRRFHPAAREAPPRFLFFGFFSAPSSPLQPLLLPTLLLLPAARPPGQPSAPSPGRSRSLRPVVAASSCKLLCATNCRRRRIPLSRPSAGTPSLPSGRPPALGCWQKGDVRHENRAPVRARDDLALPADVIFRSWPAPWQPLMRRPGPAPSVDT